MSNACILKLSAVSVGFMMITWSIRRQDKILMSFLLSFNTLLTIIVYFFKIKNVLAILQRIQDIFHRYYILKFESKYLKYFSVFMFHNLLHYRHAGM